jgi:Glucodextranase, domain N
VVRALSRGGLDAGCVTEVYYPTIDTPQIRDLQFLFTDGETFFHDERRNFTSEIDCVSEAALGFEVTIGRTKVATLFTRPSLETPIRIVSSLTFALMEPQNCFPS